MFTKRIITSRRGSAVIIGMFALMILLAFGVSFVSVAVSNLYSAKRDDLSSRALAIAEAGIERGISFVRVDGNWHTTHPSSNPDDHTGDTWFNETLATGESFRICVRTAAGGDADRLVITSVSTVIRGDDVASRTLRVVVERKAENVNCWNNVIFAGVGQAGHSINGNVVMRGSIHLLGDGEPFTDIDHDGKWDNDEAYTDSNHNGVYNLGEPYTDTDHDGHRDSREPFTDLNGNGSRDPALTVTDLAEEMSGTADVGNNYSGMSSTLTNKVPAIPTTTFNGETVGTLDAKLRVKHGQVGISGAATVGSGNTAGNSIKETMDGCYVTDGYTGNKGASSVYSDNGSNADYDLGDGLVTFPSLADPCPPYGTYQDYLQSTSYVRNGALTLGTSTSYVFGDANGGLVYNKDTKTLTVYGKVYVSGDITLDTSIKYVGAGTLISTGDININGNLLPNTGFPLTDRLGLIAAHNMTVGGSSQLTVAAACYAQYQINIPKQTEFAGTCVSSYFSVKNVPHLYQVPALKDNLPPGMPGSDPIWVIDVSVLSWQDVSGSSSQTH